MQLKTVLNPKFYISTLKLLLAIPVAKCFKKSGNGTWLISERPDQARDNGYVFFKFMREEHPEQPVFYVIKKDSADREKIARYGNIIEYDSFRHYVYYCASKVHISAHDDFCAPSSAPFARTVRRWLKIKNVFLPHGVSYGISDFVLAKYGKIDLFICSGRPEYENVLANYGYREDQLAYTGFPRLDAWHSMKVNEKQIVVMPTWRAYLAQDPGTVIEDTCYFKAWQSFLDSKELAAVLADSGCRLIFYLHDSMRRFAGSFSSACPNVEVVYDDRYDIQELLKSSALLITDYSSVHFDFAYMGKPVIYYQFDREEFFSKQYQKGLFDVENDGFGPVVFSEEELISAFSSVVRSGFTVSDEYSRRMRAFYELHDDKNCERVYERIKDLCLT